MRVFFLFATLFAFQKRLLRYLQYLQQEDYNGRRFVNWLWNHKIYDTRLSRVALVALFFSSTFPSITLFCASCALFWLLSQEEDPKKKGKIPLKLTPRARRIHFVAALFHSALFLLSTLLFSNLFFLCFLFAQTLPLSLLVALGALSWSENKKQLRLAKEAQEKILADAPYIVGITGSYGKTSAKHLLGNILQITLGPTFWPERGINTVMGITREIKERWQKGYRYAVTEMGAYQPGSIERLCSFTPPNAGWITQIGVAHLERFTSEAKIFSTKAELAKALPPGALLVLNGESEGCRKLAQEEGEKKILLYGFDNRRYDLAVWVRSYSFSEKGTRFELVWQEKSYKGSSPMVGSSALSNIAGAFAMATALGANPELTLAALSQIEPVENRLQIGKGEKGSLYLHDAYNSNPVGFQSALEVLQALPVKRRLLMTPGMVELGTQQERWNRELAKQASQICDWILLVGQENREVFKKTLEALSFPEERLLFCQDREEAFKKLTVLELPDDGILIENDLNDLYEKHPRF